MVLGSLVSVVVVVDVDESLAGDALLHVVADIGYWDANHYLDLELPLAEGAEIPVKGVCQRWKMARDRDRDHLNSIGQDIPEGGVVEAEPSSAQGLVRVML